jgi:hypothetical protein
MATTPFILQDIQKVSYAINAVDKDGNATSLPAGDSVLVASSDATIASVAPDAAPAAGSVASGFILGGKTLGTAQISFTAVGADGATPDATIAAAGQSVQVVSGSAASLSPVLGTPVNQ